MWLYFLVVSIFLAGLVGVYLAGISYTKDVSEKKIYLFDRFARGTFLGLAFIHFLPEALESIAASNSSINVLMTTVALCCYFLQFSEKSIINHRYKDNCKKMHWCHYLVFLILLLHSIVEGGVIGIEKSLSTMLMIGLGVLAHKSAAGFALVGSLLAVGVNSKRINILVIIFIVSTPLSILVFNLLQADINLLVNPALFGYLQAIAAGVFIYIGVGHHVNYSKDEYVDYKFNDIICYGVGLLFVILISWLH